MKNTLGELHQPFMNNDERWEELWKKVCETNASVIVLVGKVDTLEEKLNANTPGKSNECLDHAKQISDMWREVRSLQAFQLKALGALFILNIAVVPLIIHFVGTKLVK